LRVGPRLGEGTHVAKVAEAEALHSGKLRAEILGEPIHHLSSPPLGRKAGGESMRRRKRRGSVMRVQICMAA
jgi:hypothetical protein